MSDEMMPGSSTGPKLRFVRDLEGEERLKEVAERMWLPHGYLRAYGAGEMKVAVGREPHDGKGLKWHISVSRPDRCPTWDELKQAKYRLLPDGVDVEMCLIFPRKNRRLCRYSPILLAPVGGVVYIANVLGGTIQGFPAT